jgi:hypothetical protein
MTAFGGDALVLYHNVAYHACYGNGVQLTNMNFPYGEYIFLTDAQGAVSVLLALLRKIGVNTCDNALGIVHFTNQIFLIAASVLMYLIFRKLNLKIWICIVFSVLVVYLSPQMLRFDNHYGLAYPFLIPMLIYYSLEKASNAKVGFFDLVVYITLTFFTLNNPYLGFAAAGCALLFSLWYFLFYNYNWKKLKQIAIIPLFSIITSFIVLKILDPIYDRIIHQWGFGQFKSSLAGSFFPQGSYLNQIFKYAGINVNDVEFNAMQNLGLVVSVAFFVFGITLLVSRILKIETIKLSIEVKSLIFAGITMFLFGSFAHLLEDSLGFILMFKAIGRLSWPFYFSTSIMVVYLIDQFLLYQLNKKMVWIYSLYLLPLVWLSEINYYIKPKYREIHHENFFSKNSIKNFKDRVNAQEFKREKYQALLCIPNTQFWSDKFLSTNHWSTHFHAVMMSMTYQMPMANALISRPSTSQYMEGIQLLAHPLIAKENLTRFEADKKILLLLGSDHPPLTKGEQHMINSGNLVFNDPGFKLYEVDLKQLVSSLEIISARQKHQEGFVDKPLFYLGFDDVGNDQRFYGRGSRKLAKGSHFIGSFTYMGAKDTTLILSAWTLVDNKKFGLGDWKVEVSGQDKFKYTHEFHPRYSRDIQHKYVRVETELKVSQKDKINIFFRGNQEHIIDELAIDYLGHDYLVDDKSSGYFIYNGYKILK